MLRKRYWSNSEFARWIQRVTGVDEKPHAATAEAWDQWKRSNQHKIGYKITEQGFDCLQDIVRFIPDKVENIWAYINNRWISKIHYIDTKMPRGQFVERDERILCACFEMLVEHVEYDLAMMYSRGNGKRSREIGLQALEEAINDEDEIQFGRDKMHQQIKELYLWWKDVRPYRLDPIDASGLNKFFDQHQSIREYLADDSEEKSRAAQKMFEIEQHYHEQDQQMLHRLIDVRPALWV